MIVQRVTLTVGDGYARNRHLDAYIREVQALLNRGARLVGAPTVAVDGDFGPATAALARRLEAHLGLVADGTADPVLIDRLQCALREDTPDPAVDLEVVYRAEWGARPPTRKLTKQPRLIEMVVHHTAGRAASGHAEGADEMRRIQRLHQDGNRWPDVGYHFVISSDGIVFQGLPFAGDRTLLEGPEFVIGTHVGGANTGRIGICLMGCFHPAEPGCRAVPSDDAIVAAGRLAGLLHRVARVPLVVKGHRDFKATACPGDLVYRQLDRIRSVARG